MPITTVQNLQDNNRSLTLGDLRHFIEAHPELPDNTPIGYHRVEDHFSTVLMPWEDFPMPSEWRVSGIPQEYQETMKPIKSVSKTDQAHILNLVHYIPGSIIYLGHEYGTRLPMVCISAHY